MKAKPNKRYDALEQHGPATAEDLGGHPSVDERRLYQMVQFNPLQGFKGVWYLPAHDPEAVIRTWLETNGDKLLSNDVTARELSSNVSPPFDAVWADLKSDGGDYEWLTRDQTVGTTREQVGRTCPKCGREDIKNLPNHLRSCDGDDDGR